MELLSRELPIIIIVVVCTHTKLIYVVLNCAEMGGVRKTIYEVQGVHGKINMSMAWVKQL